MRACRALYPFISGMISRVLCGSFREGTVYMHVVSFRFVSKQRETSNAMGMSIFFDILITSKGTSALSIGVEIRDGCPPLHKQ